MRMSNYMTNLHLVFYDKSYIFIHVLVEPMTNVRSTMSNPGDDLRAAVRAWNERRNLL